MLLTALVVIGIILILISVFSISDNLIQIEAQKEGIDTQKTNLSLIPSFKDLFSPSMPSYIDGKKLHRLKKGMDINLAGQASDSVSNANVARYAVRPQLYRGLSPIPKMEVAVGDEVLAGQVLFFDKKNPDVKFVSPVSGEVVEIRRGDKRAISHVVILGDKTQKSVVHTPPSLENASRNELVEYLQASGGWSLINQRPFDILADAEVIPENIFISTFNTAPLSADMNIIISGKEAAFQKGIDVLRKLTNGKVVLGLDGRGKSKPHSVFTDANGVEKHWFAGKHPVGNVGVQIHHTRPIKATDTVWTLNPEDVAVIGELFISGTYDASKMVALAGSEVIDPQYYRTYKGASIAELTKNSISEGDEVRYISGDVLTGEQVDKEDFLNDKHNLVTVVKEGDNYELFGWLLPLKPRPSASGTFPNFLLKNYEFEVDTNTHGEERAFVVSGQYEDVLPMDVYVQHLMKAIMTGDIERMEGLGINELSEEDVALCEFICTSKQPLQSILRDGLDMMREQA